MYFHVKEARRALGSEWIKDHPGFLEVAYDFTRTSRFPTAPIRLIYDSPPGPPRLLALKNTDIPRSRYLADLRVHVCQQVSAQRGIIGTGQRTHASCVFENRLSLSQILTPYRLTIRAQADKEFVR